jgi:hypothetical protein
MPMTAASVRSTHIEATALWGKTMKSAIEILHRVAATGFAGIACLTLSACMTSSPVWDAHMGEALKTVMDRQIINPVPQPSTEPPRADGRAAVAAMDNYDKSLRTPVPTTSPFVIGIGSGTSMAVSGGAAQ